MQLARKHELPSAQKLFCIVFWVQAAKPHMLRPAGLISVRGVVPGGSAEAKLHSSCFLFKNKHKWTGCTHILKFTSIRTKNPTKQLPAAVMIGRNCARPLEGRTDADGNARVALKLATPPWKCISRDRYKLRVLMVVDGYNYRFPGSQSLQTPDQTNQLERSKNPILTGTATTLPTAFGFPPRLIMNEPWGKVSNLHLSSETREPLFQTRLPDEIVWQSYVETRLQTNDATPLVTTRCLHGHWEGAGGCWDLLCMHWRWEPGFLLVDRPCSNLLPAAQNSPPVVLL